MAFGYRFLNPDIDIYLPSIKGYWPLEDENDLCRVNDLTNNGTVIFDVGQNNNAAYFDTGDFLSITDAAQTGLEPAGGFSISSWVFISSFGSDAYHVVVSKTAESGGNRSYLLMVRKSTSVVHFAVSAAGTMYVNMETTGTITLGVWNHIFCRFTPSTEIAVWINGVKETFSTAIPASVFNGNADFMIGNRNAGGFPARMNGRIDEVTFIDDIVLDVGVTAFYNLGNGRFPQKPLAKSISRFDIRAKQTNKSISRFDVLRNKLISVTPASRFDIRAKQENKSISRFDVHARIRSNSVSRFDIRAKQENNSTSRFTIRGKGVSKSISLSNSFFQDGFKLVARNIATGIFTDLGFIPKGSTTLNGIALADATYDIEARPSGNYWQDVRSTLFLRVEIVSGEIVAAKPPAVRNLRALDLTGFGRDILWTYQNDFGTVAPTDFALYFGPTSPVSTAGAPDLTITARAPGATHLRRRVQVAAEFVAVVARDAAEVQGPPSEIFLTFPSGVITSPDRQWAVRGT